MPPEPTAPPAAGNWSAWRDFLARRRGDGRHAWNAWQSYLTIHDNWLLQYSPDFLLADRLMYEANETVVWWHGELVFVSGLEIHVDKEQERRADAGGPHVRTATYSYHVLQRKGVDERPLWRYDNTGKHGHPDRHHTHYFRPDGVDEVTHLGEGGWPTLGNVVDDLYAWWRVHVRDIFSA